MELERKSQTNLVAGLDRVYNGYVALDCSESAKIFEQQSLSEVAHQMVAQLQIIELKEMEKHFRVGEQRYVIKLTKKGSDGLYSISIEPAQKSQLMTFDDVENPDNAEQVVALLASQSIEIDPKKPQPYINVDNHDNSAPIRIGGDKMSLYRTHLVTLHKIRERLLAGKDVSNLLIAQATGSGKTFVQALWLASLHSAGMKGFFGVPGKLEEQFRKDLKRLLPKEFIDEKVGELGEPNSNEGFLGQNKNIVVGNAFQALDEHFDQLDKCDPQDVMLSFDEQHLLMRVERRRLRLIDLSERFLSCFLTATPMKKPINCVEKILLQLCLISKKKRQIKVKYRKF